MVGLAGSHESGDGVPLVPRRTVNELTDGKQHNEERLHGEISGSLL